MIFVKNKNYCYKATESAVYLIAAMTSQEVTLKKLLTRNELSDDITITREEFDLNYSPGLGPLKKF